jgi:hypothetical protein
VILREWWDRMLARYVSQLEACGVPRNRDWLVLFPSGPHMAGEMMRGQAGAMGGLRFTIDMDPRWVKKLISAGRAEEADAYAEHLIDQAAFMLQSQDVGVLACTPPLLERFSRRDDLVRLIGEKVDAIEWVERIWTRTPGICIGRRCFPGWCCTEGMAALWCSAERSNAQA